MTTAPVSAGPGYPSIPSLDRVVRAPNPTFGQYLQGASSYIVHGRDLPTKGTRRSKSAKAAQSDLSKVLAGIMARELYDRHRKLILNELGAKAFTATRGQTAAHVLMPAAKETRVAGGLRTAQSDVTES